MCICGYRYKKIIGIHIVMNFVYKEYTAYSVETIIFRLEYTICFTLDILIFFFIDHKKIDIIIPTLNITVSFYIYICVVFCI